MASTLVGAAFVGDLFASDAVVEVVAVEVVVVAAAVATEAEVSTTLGGAVVTVTTEAVTARPPGPPDTAIELVSGWKAVVTMVSGATAKSVGLYNPEYIIIVVGPPGAPPAVAGGGGGGASDSVGIGVAETISVPSSGTNVVVGVAPGIVSNFNRCLFAKKKINSLRLCFYSVYTECGRTHIHQQAPIPCIYTAQKRSCT